MASSSFGKKLKRMFKKSKSSKKTIKGREDAAADEMYFSCSESFDDAGEEAKGINRRFSFGNNKKKELANVQPDDSKGLKELHNIVVTSEQKEMLKKVIAKVQSRSMTQAKRRRESIGVFPLATTRKKS